MNAWNRILRLFPAVFSTLLFAGTAGHTGIVVTNFSAASPIRIMPVGDSITDDCEVPGSWRMPLQPMLSNAAIPFTFIGRNITTGLTRSFTQTHHEGYCGAVIAAPGEFPAYNYSDVQNYLEQIVPDALKSTQATNPNVILVLIGANDIGQGRDPYHTANIDMTNLLHLIFTKVPAANVIFSKITTLSNAGIGYLAFATNVPIYNNALEQMVNQQRAAGRNVALADMFSVAPYGNTYFGSDHLHPSPAGLTNIANEWSTRIKTLLTGTNQITTALVNAGATWTYSYPGNDLGTNWTQLDYDDSAWAAGAARFGYSEPVPETTVRFGVNSSNVNTTTYFRTKFVVPWNQYFTNLNFRLSQTGGAVVWLNGQEAYRTNLPAGSVAYSSLATTNIVGDAEYTFFPNNLSATLPPGTNIVAVEVHQSSTNNPNLGFDLELLGGAFVMPPPSLSAVLANGGITLSWPLTNGSAFQLYSTTSLVPANWQPDNATLQTNNGQITAIVAPGPGPNFFRLQLSQ